MSVALRPVLTAAMWLGAILPAQAGERDQFNACQALVERAAQSAKPDQANAGEADREIQRCRQIIKEWTLRDSRRSVDENGQPLR